MINPSKPRKKNIEEILQQAKEIPLIGAPPPFPWTTFNHLLKDQLNHPEFHVDIRQADWIAAGEWRAGLGDEPQILAFEAPPLKGRLFWAASSEEMREMSSALLTSGYSISKNHKETPLSFFQGFYRFLFLEALDALTESGAFPILRFSLAEEMTIPEEPLLSIELTISLKGTKSSGRIMIPSQFLGSFREFYRLKARKDLSADDAARIDVLLSLVIGKSTLKYTRWKEIGIGDLLLLDHCHYHPHKKQGKAHLVLEGTSIALCSLRGHSVEVLDYSTYEEEPMKNEYNEPEEDFSSFDENDDEETSKEDQDEQDLEEESPLEDYDEELDDEEYEDAHPDAEDEEFVEEEYGDALHDEQRPHKVTPAMHEMPSLTKDLPITLSIEVARIRMNLDKVLGLLPGNILELSTTPEQGVTITANGKALARGELIQLGELLGVKITHLG
jgi:flagellar motor switch protein FliN